MRQSVLATVFLLFIQTACVSVPARAPVKSIADLRPTVILVSLDGFRADYLDRFHPATLEALALEGVRARRLRPVFPTLTFPNHYTLVTGLYPERHGIVSNNMKDPRIDEIFTLSNQSVVRDPRWWGGEPIWNTAVKQGQKAATMFWPGSDVEISGTRPTYWKTYDGKFPADQRVDQVLEWLDLPVEQRPTFLSLYFESPDAEGHEFGPASSEVRAAVERVDGHLARLWRGLQQRQIADAVTLVVVSDHGMVEIRTDRRISLASYLDLSKVEILGGGAYAGLYPAPAELEKTYQVLRKAHPHMQVFKKNQIPARFHHQNNARIAPLVLLADEGYYISGKNPKLPEGGHGYDSQLDNMSGLFVARGPRLKVGYLREDLQNIHVYSLLTRLLGLHAAANDGDPSKTDDLFKNP